MAKSALAGLGILIVVCAPALFGLIMVYMIGIKLGVM